MDAQHRERDLIRLLEAIRVGANVGIDAAIAHILKDKTTPGSPHLPSTEPLDEQLVERPENWNEAVKDVLASMPRTFRFKDVYQDEHFAKHFPGNQSISQSVANVLKDLIADGKIEQIGRGEYRRLDDPDIDAVDTVVVPARQAGFEYSAIERRRWRAIRLHSNMIPKIKYIAFYRVSPESAIDYIAEVGEVLRDLEEAQKYQLMFKGAAQKIKAVHLVPGGKVPALRNIRYTTREKLLHSRTLDELWPNGAV